MNAMMLMSLGSNVMQPSKANSAPGSTSPKAMFGELLANTSESKNHVLMDSDKGGSLEELMKNLEEIFSELVGELEELTDGPLSELSGEELLEAIPDDVLDSLISNLNELSELNDQKLESVLEGLSNELGLDETLNVLGKALTESLINQIETGSEGSNQMNPEEIAMFVLPGQSSQNVLSNSNGNTDSSMQQKTESVLARLASIVMQTSQSNQQQADSKWQQLLQQVRAVKEEQMNLSQLQGRQSTDGKTIRQAIHSILNENQVNGQDRNSQMSFGQVRADQGEWSNQMSKVEQFTIHINRPSVGTSSNQSSQQQMIEQLQKIIQSSQFGKTNGTNQLNIQLKPANLGNMSLQFTQVDGQTMVKISVMSYAAKEMVESNLNQLRHMFQPNQVVVERQVDQSNADYTKQQSAEEEKQDEQSREQQALADDEQEEVSTNFKDYLFQEEV
ncbi:flagellar hook-length control protein FliK [Halalkalibacillus halophilus]|uniref:flagellar hook-length control protein FliK n=1 Tax=Halalkalibacillus halophilus TaxID=392827 RepID=UPI000428F8A3|nr:flagellar hook-length control protein FliK [Halalkalibacillus halophilus]